MNVYFDSSSLAKRYIDENGSAEVESILQETSQLAVSIIAVPEILSGLNRRVREGSITSADYVEVKKHLADDMTDMITIQLVPEVIATCIKLLEKTPLRAMEALHVACAVEWNAGLFVTSDKRQLPAARHAGLESNYVGPPN